MPAVNPAPGAGPEDTTVYVDCCTKAEEMSPKVVRNPEDI